MEGGLSKDAEYGGKRLSVPGGKPGRPVAPWNLVRYSWAASCEAIVHHAALAEFIPEKLHRNYCFAQSCEGFQFFKGLFLGKALLSQRTGHFFSVNCLLGRLCWIVEVLCLIEHKC